MHSQDSVMHVFDRVFSTLTLEEAAVVNFLGGGAFTFGFCLVFCSFIGLLNSLSNTNLRAGVVDFLGGDTFTWFLFGFLEF